MPTESLSTIHLPMPDDFDIASYESVTSRIASLNEAHPDSWPEYSGGWSAIGYRFYACAEYDESFSRSFRQHPGLPPALERYGQERDLYGFFVSGLSVIESFFYGLYAIAAMVRSDRFPIATDDSKRNVHPNMVRDKFASVFPNEPVTLETKALLDDQGFEAWKYMRNMLAHRSSPGRNLAIAVGGGAEHRTTDWGELRLHENFTWDRRRWLASSLSALMRAADEFTANHPDLG